MWNGDQGDRQEEVELHTPISCKSWDELIKIGEYEQNTMAGGKTCSIQQAIELAISLAYGKLYNGD